MATATLLGLTLTLPSPALTLLRLGPLVGSTASLTHAYMEYLTNSSFLSVPPLANSLTKSMAKDSHSGAPRNADAVATAKDVLVPVWFVNFFNTGLWSVIGLNTLTTASALANLFLFPLPQWDSAATASIVTPRPAYLVGLTAALAHYAFVPGVAGSVERLYGLCVRQARGEAVKEGEKGVAEASVREWVGWHKVRMASVDVCAWVAFVVGVVGVLTP